MPNALHGLSTWALGAALWVASASVAGAATDSVPDGSGAPTPDAAFSEKGRDLLQDALPCLRSVLERSRFREAAAWLVEPPLPGGELGCLAWPPTEEAWVARWSGPLPRGLLGQVHSHSVRAPASLWKASPRPSEQDCKTARRLGIPVLTVSPDGVYECRPGDGRVGLRLRAGWERKPTAEVQGRHLLR